MDEEKESKSLTSPEFKSIDTVLSRIGYGAYQNYIFLVCGVGQIADGIELTAISMLTPILKSLWELSVLQMGILGGVIFIGMILGNAISAYIGDRVGRVMMLQRSTLILFIASTLSGIMPEFWSFMATRFFVGLADGMIIPIASSYAAEICPKEFRGKYLISMGFCFVFGSLLVIILFISFDSVLGASSWRYVLIVAALPGLIAYILLLFLVQESPRFLASRRKSDESIASLNFISRMNGQPPLSTEEEQGIRDYEVKVIQQGFRKVLILFDSQHIRRSVQLVILWFSAVFTYYGILFILPQTLDASNRTHSNIMMLLTALIQLPATAVNVITIDHPYLGRKLTISICLALQTVCFGIGAGTVQYRWSFIPAMAMAMFFISIWFSTLYPYTAELYHTSLRSLAYGSLNVIARIGGAVAPTILLGMDAVGLPWPYAFLGGISILAAINAAILPYETRNFALDQEFDK